MRILIAEDDQEAVQAYKDALQSRNHQVTITRNGEECLKVYNKDLTRPKKEKEKEKENKSKNAYSSFEVVVLDYKMPKKDGMEVAKEIFDLNHEQRIVFVSAYVRDTLEDSVKQLKRVVELIQKPFDIDVFIDTIEDIEVYEGLKNLVVNVRQIKDNNPTKKQINELIEGLRKIQKTRAF
jgi:DNA-binding response OmpR family regulator